MLSVGLTGGIGSGKSSIAHVFSALSIPVFSSDEVSKSIIFSKEHRAQLLDLFPELEERGSVADGGEAGFDAKSGSSAVAMQNDETQVVALKKRLANIVFSSPKKLALLNSFAHPLVANALENWLKAQKSPYAIVESAILIESNWHKKMDKIIVVDCPREVQISRVCQREKCSQKEVIQRIEKQISREERLKYANFVIKNYGNESVLEAVFQIDKELRGA